MTLPTRATVRRRALPALALCVLALGGSPATGQDRPIDFDSRGTRVHASFPGDLPLTAPSEAPAREVVRTFLAERHAPRILESLEERSGFTAHGRTHVRLRQRVEGLEVYGTYVKAAVDEDGSLVHLIENLHAPPRGPLPPATITPADALAAALAENHPGQRTGLAVTRSEGATTWFDTDGFFWQEPRVTRVAIPLKGAAMREGFLVETWEAASNRLVHTLVSGNGRVFGTELRTNTDSYNVFAEHPGVSPQGVAFGAGGGTPESPLGWLDPGTHLSIHITGNNSLTYLDSDANNVPDAGGGTINDGNFLAIASLGLAPTTLTNQEVAVQNLFYLTNVIHDRLYRYGFTELRGNFQQDNFGLGGVGGDPVKAEAQDGSGTNNANFATPSDGTSGRMQMFLWTLTSPNLDGSLDSDIVWHEYGHGLTWRMIGSMSGPLSGAIGEGMSDGLAVIVNDDDVVGEYSFNNPAGIRSAPYTGYGRTYGDFTGGSVHFDGEIYAAILWDLWKRFESNGLSKDLLLTYLVDGMTFTPAGPTFEDMRDGILQAAAESRRCLVWESFASFGVGTGASATLSGGPFFPTVTIIEDFGLPAECTGGFCSTGLTRCGCFAQCECGDGTEFLCTGTSCASGLDWVECDAQARRFCG